MDSDPLPNTSPMPAGMDALYVPLPDTDADSSSDSSIEYEDEAGLIQDMQALLADHDCSSSDMVAIVGQNAEELALHTQVVGARSPVLATALRYPWRRRTFHLTSQDPETMRDVLEFLYTGAVRLEQKTGSAVKIAAAAHFFGVQELEDIAIEHIRIFLNEDSFSAHLKSVMEIRGTAVPDSVTQLLATFATSNATMLLRSAVYCDRDVLDHSQALIHSKTLVQAIWYLLAYNLATNEALPAKDCRSVAVSFLEWSSWYATSTRSTPPVIGQAPSLNNIESDSHLTVQPLIAILDSASSRDERDALISVLSCIGSPIRPLMISRKVGQPSAPSEISPNGSRVEAPSRATPHRWDSSLAEDDVK
jgi:BTB/POZ domain